VGFSAAAALHYLQPPAHEPDSTKAPKPPEPIPLIADGEPGRQLHWVARETEPVVHRRKAGEPFSVSCTRVCLLELLDRPPRLPFRLEAELRLGPGQVERSVGIYFARVRHQNAKEAVQFFWAYWMSEFPRAENGIQRGLSLYRFGEAPPHFCNSHKVPFRESSTLPPSRGGVPGQWRTLKVDVAADQVVTRWGDEPLQTVPIRTIHTLTHSMFKNTDITGGAYDPHAGLGLLLCGGQAFFRQVTFTPL
jgi:hypothetical protein